MDNKEGMVMAVYGLIGRSLGHSFSKQYFTDKFSREKLNGCHYKLFELKNIDEIKQLLQQQPGLRGFNVTIPYKEAVMPYLDKIDQVAKRINAVNVVRIMPDGHLAGYNSDYFGFRHSLVPWLGIPGGSLMKALVLGTGGASKAVKAVLEDLNIPFTIVSRHASGETISYDYLKDNPQLLLNSALIVNTTPLGMSPAVAQRPDLDYALINSSHYLYDLIYNPEETFFLKTGLEKGAQTKNGLEMLRLQAEKSWEIWQQPN